MPPGLFLGFDAATKTFAWSLGRIDLAGVAVDRRDLDALRRAVESLGRAVESLQRDLGGGRDAAELRRDIDTASAAAESARVEAARLDAASASRVAVLAGATADLAPGVADVALPTVARIRAVAGYVRGVVAAAVAAARAATPGLPLRVVVEYQMGDNAPARAVAAALVTLFIDEDVVFVGPTLKNTVALAPSLRLGEYNIRYSSYTANKNQSRDNFDRILALYPNSLAPMTAARRGHVADSFMQILGMLVNGDGKENTRF